MIIVTIIIITIIIIIITSECEKLAQKNTKDDTTMFQRKFIGIFVKITG